MYLQYDNRHQLDLVARAEALVGPNDRYFDGVGMLPNRSEPSTLWLDRASIQKTVQAGARSEAHRIFSNSPPKIIIWSLRMDGIYPVVAPIIKESYVQVAPNIRMAGRRLKLGVPTRFDAPLAGSYDLYSPTGQPQRGNVEINGKALSPPLWIDGRSTTVTLRSGPTAVLLLPKGSYAGKLKPGDDNKQLFSKVYQ
jgi:hypothetical protein